MSRATTRRRRDRSAGVMFDLAQRWLGKSAGLLLAGALLAATPAGAQTRLSERDQVAYLKALELENSIAEFLANPDVDWFDSKSQRIDQIVDELADRMKVIAKTPDALLKLSPCDFARNAIEIVVIMARSEFWTSRDPVRARNALAGNGLTMYAESMRQCELLAGIHKRAHESPVIGKHLRCLETGVDCDK